MTSLGGYEGDEPPPDARMRIRLPLPPPPLDIPRFEDASQELQRLRRSTGSMPVPRSIRRCHESAGPEVAVTPYSALDSHPSSRDYRPEPPQQRSRDLHAVWLLVFAIFACLALGVLAGAFLATTESGTAHAAARPSGH